MPNFYTRTLIFCILLFHLAISLHGFYIMFIDYQGWTIFHIRPILQMIFTLAWAGIFFKKRWSFFVYLSLMFYELAMKLFFGKYIFGEIFGDIFFPADLVFAMIILFLYKQHFNARETKVTV